MTAKKAGAVGTHSYGGFTLKVWGVRCSICGFISGIVELDGPGVWRMVTGAGCRLRPRRSPEVALKQAKAFVDNLNQKEGL